MKTVRAVDLFCGAGGSSRGGVDACAELGVTLDLLAINHWSVAIATHEKNLPGVRHECADIASVNPSAAVPGGRVDLLWASPECKQHSTARGGKPINDQKRADPWQIVRWLSELYVKAFVIENVPEFRAWGPVDPEGRPIKKYRGRTYQAFLSAIVALGYKVEARLLCAADYGDPTTRRRLFILGRRDGRKIRWPEPSHGRPGNLLGLAPWKSARDHVIDWSISSPSIFGRKRPLAKNTMERIIAGLQKFGGPELGPFLVVLRGTDPYHLQASARPIELPIGAVCASANHFGLVEPVGGAFTLSQQSGGAPRDVSEPIQAVATKGAISVVEFLVPRYGERDGQKPRTHSLDGPMPTVPTTCQHHLAQAFVMSAGGPKVAPRSVAEPMNTVLTRDHMGLVQPFLMHVNHGDNPKGSGRGNGGRVRPTTDPLPTVTGSRGLALVEALIAKYYGTGIAKPVTEPLDTVTSRDRFGLVTFAKGQGLALDIRFRMLKPRELARAQGFPDDYEFTGDTEDQVCQIGNANPRHLSRALWKAQLG